MRRRTFAAAAAAFVAAPVVLRAQPVRARQFINDVKGSTLYVALTDMWSAVRNDTSGGLDVTVFPDNGNVPGSDPEVLRMLQQGSVQFFTLNGAILSTIVPAFDLQSLPLVYRNRAEALRVIDGAAGAYLVNLLRPHGIHAVTGAVFDNGMRQVTTTSVPLRAAEDVVGMRWRIPRSAVFREFVSGVGAVPLEININEMLAGIRSGKVEAQDNPLSFVDAFHLASVQHHLNLTNHMWAGFNFLANESFFNGLAANARASIERRLPAAVVAQRAAQNARNETLMATLNKQMSVTHTDVSGFAPRLQALYARRRATYGEHLWSLMQHSLGRDIGAAA